MESYDTIKESLEYAVVSESRCFNGFFMLPESVNISIPQNVEIQHTYMGDGWIAKLQSVQYGVARFKILHLTNQFGSVYY